MMEAILCKMPTLSMFSQVKKGGLKVKKFKNQNDRRQRSDLLSLLHCIPFYNMIIFYWWGRAPKVGQI